jgi:hypothetical protein
VSAAAGRQRRAALAPSGSPDPMDERADNDDEDGGHRAGSGRAAP